MIEVKNLCKVYKSSKRQETHALKNISFTLPDKGMVFIVGKSGSGKSTLLNLLGGIDKITSGSIVVDGIDFSEIEKKHAFDAFRNSYMGFIFQDYYLMETLNVFDNVKLALDLKGQKDKEKVKKTLELVQLSGYENRLPKELSGGQAQRVAIARAIIKEPKLILADEPTGNLDEDTTTQILDILKELSKKSLVVIVSHNLENANYYADRIIKLNNGRIVSDKSRSNHGENKLKFEKNKIILPYAIPLSKQDLVDINDKIKTGKPEISQHGELFIDTPKITRKFASKKQKLSRSRLGFGTSLKLAGKFTKSGIINFIVSIIIVSFLISLLSLFHMLYSYEGNGLLQHAIGNQNNFIFYRSYDMTATTKEDEALFINEGYSGNIYKLYNFNPIKNKIMVFGEQNSDEKNLKYALDTYHIERSIYSNFFTEYTQGTLICDEAYLKKVFKDAEYIVNPKQYDDGVIITDYIADSILYYYSKPNLLTSNYNYIFESNKWKINAIINTKYKETYSNVIKMNSNNLNPEIDDVSDAYQDFINDAGFKLNIAYALNDNFLQHRTNCSLEYCFKNEDTTDNINDVKIVLNNELDSTNEEINWQLDNNQIILSEYLFEKIFFKQNEIENMEDVNRSNPLIINARIRWPEWSLTYPYSLFKVVGFVENDYSNNFYVNEETFNNITQTAIRPIGLAFDDTSEITKMHMLAHKERFLPLSLRVNFALTGVSGVNVYHDFFLELSIPLVFVALLFLINFGRRNVKKRSFEIGIIKALGGKKSEFVKIFVLQMIFACVLICLLSVIGMLGFTYIANTSFTKIIFNGTNYSIFNGLKIFYINPINVGVILAIVIGISMLALSVPLIMLNRIKPIKIIKNKD